LPKLVSLLEAGERGQYADLQWTYYFMERSDAMIYSILQRRRAALQDSNWDIRQVANGDPVLAGEQSAFLREVYDGIENFKDALALLFTGFFRGYAHLEKHYDAAGGMVRLEPLGERVAPYHVRLRSGADVAMRRMEVGVEPAAVIAAVCKACGNAASVLRRRRHRGPARLLAARLLRDETGLAQRAIVSELGLREGAGVGRLLRLASERIKTDRRLRPAYKAAAALVAEND
jgi:hypothetical protein